MLKKLALFITVFSMLVLIASPASAMLRILEPETSQELQVIAQEHLANSMNIDASAITINETWLRELFSLKVDVYMVIAVIDQGLPTEQRVEVPVRVDTKAVLSESELAQLIEEDKAMTPDEPIMRAMSLEVDTEEVTDAVQEAVPISAEINQVETVSTNNTIFFVGAAILLIGVLAGALVLKKRKA